MTVSLFVLGLMIPMCVHVSTIGQGVDIHVSQCIISHDLVYGGILANCSGLGIRELPVHGLPDNITTLILSHNNISRLHNHSFYQTNLRSLRQLNVRASNVTEIEVEALFGLDNLDILDLEYNDLPLYQTEKRSFPGGMFRHVPKLRHLFIGYNTKDHDLPSGHQNYPDNIDIFSWLPHLTNLSIDSVNDTLYLGPEFYNLTHLVNLTMVCRQVLYIHNNSLEGLWQLQVKVLSLVAFRKIYPTIEADAFQNLSHLMFLTVDSSNVGNHNILKALKPLANRTMTALNLRRTNFFETYSVPGDVFSDGIISYKLATYLRSICVGHTAWTDSVLFAFEPNSLTTDAWPECIKTIDLSNNKLGHTGWVMVIMELRRLIHLRDFTISASSAPPSDQFPRLIHYNFPDVRSRSDEGRDGDHMNIDKTDNTNSSEQMLPGSLKNTIRDVPCRRMNNIYLGKDNRHVSQESHSTVDGWQRHNLGKSGFPYNGNITYYFPPSLRMVKIINLIFAPITMGGWTIVCKNSHLEEFYWINNNCLVAHGVIHGLENMKLVDFTGSEFDMADYFLDTLHGLQVLILSDIKPDTFFKQISVQRLLRNLTNLRYLDVSNNKLNSLLFPPTTFISNPNVTHVILSQNRFSNIPFDLDTTPNLHVLDLSANAILFLTEEEMKTLNNHVLKVGHFLLRLQDNGIACVCSQMNLLVWIFTTYVTVDLRSAVECLTEDGQMVQVNDLADIPTFCRACQGRIFLMASLVLTSLMGAVFLLAYLVTRFQTSIEAFLLKIFVGAFRPVTPKDYKIGVVIGYADDDHVFVRHVLRKYLEDTLGFSTFIHQRDLLPGRYTDEAFFKAIRDSWRVLLLLSRTFLKDYEMADIVMKYASHSVTSVNQHRVFVMVEADHVMDIPDYLDNVLDETQIIILQDLDHQLDYVERQSIKQCLRVHQ